MTTYHHQKQQRKTTATSTAKTKPIIISFDDDDDENDNDTRLRSVNNNNKIGSDSSNDITDSAAATTTTTTTTRGNSVVDEEGHNNMLDRQWLLRLIQERHPCSTQKYIFATAPMIEQSDKAFRILTRRYGGSNLTYTPMIHATTFVKKIYYQHKMFHFVTTTNNHNNDCNQNIDIDRPLIGQIAGANKDVLLEAARLIEPFVDGIDLNLGCPTLTAKRGRYGAYLLGSGSFVINIVRHLCSNLHKPVTIKVRMLPESDKYDNIEKSIQLYQSLIDAGVAMITIHGRTKDQTNANIGKADWDFIKLCVERLGVKVPILANGNIACYEDVMNCIKYTGVDGVMSSEAILEYPPIVFQPMLSSLPTTTTTTTTITTTKRPGPGRLQIAYEYLKLAKHYFPDRGNGATGMQCIRMHIDTFLHGDWPNKEDPLRIRMLKTQTINELYPILEEVHQRQLQTNHTIEKETLSWYYRHRSKEGTLMT